MLVSQLHSENEKSLLSSSRKQTISQSNLLAGRNHWLSFYSTQFKGQRVVFHPTLLSTTQTRKLNQVFHISSQSLNCLPHICTLTCTHFLSEFLQNSLFQTYSPKKTLPKLMSLAKDSGSKKKKHFNKISNPSFLSNASIVSNCQDNKTKVHWQSKTNNPRPWAN